MKPNRIILTVSLIVMALFIACDDETPETLNPAFSSNLQEVVAGENVVFKDESMGSPSKWNWYFEGGTPESSILFSPTVTYDVPGTYSVRLVVGRGDDSVEIVREKYITVNYPSEIVVDFTCDKTIGTNEDSFKFEDKSTGHPSEWLWEFTSDKGTVVKSTEQNPMLKFEPGIYSLKLTAKNPKATATKTVDEYITVIDKYSVAADILATSRNTYAGGTIQFKDNSSGVVKGWKWTFEGGEPYTSTEQNPIVTYSTPGKYKVTLNSYNEKNSSTIEKECYVVVIPSEKLVMYLPFDEGLSDISPNRLDPKILRKGDSKITISAETRFDGDESNERSSANFTSTDANNYSILSMPETDVLDFGSSDFSVSFWVKLPKISKNSAIFHHGSGPGVRPDKQNRQTWFRFQPSGQFVRFAVEQSGKAGNWTEYKEKRMDDNVWHQYTLVYKTEGDVKNSYMYIDGVMVTSSLNKSIKTIDKNPYLIGANYRYKNGAFSPENFFKGGLDDYILYNRALSEEEVVQLYDYLK